MVLCISVYRNMYSNMCISWWVYFVTGFSYVLQQLPTARLAKTKADIMNKSTHSWSSHWFCPTVTTSALIAALVQLCSRLSPLAAILAQTAQPQEEKVPLRDLHNFLFFLTIFSLVPLSNPQWTKKISKIIGSGTNSEICRTWGL